MRKGQEDREQSYLKDSGLCSSLVSMEFGWKAPWHIWYIFIFISSLILMFPVPISERHDPPPQLCPVKVRLFDQSWTCWHKQEWEVKHSCSFFWGNQRLFPASVPQVQQWCPLSVLRAFLAPPSCEWMLSAGTIATYCCYTCLFAMANVLEYRLNVQRPEAVATNSPQEPSPGLPLLCPFTSELIIALPRNLVSILTKASKLIFPAQIFIPTFH